MSISRAYTIVVALQSFATAWMFATYVIFLLDRGYTLLHANLLNVVFMTGNVLFDPPTGRMADRFGQKKLYIAGQFAWGGGMWFYGFGTHFIHFGIGELIAAVGHSLMSGALDSWLRNNTDEETTHRTLSRSGALLRLASIPSAALGGVVGATWGLEWPWRLGALFSVLAGVTSLTLLSRFPESYRDVEADGRLPGIGEVARNMMRIAPLRYVILVAFFSTMFFQPLNMFWAPIMEERSGIAWWLGGLWAGMAGAMALGSYAAQHKMLTLNGVGIAIVLASIGLPILALIPVPNALAVALLFVAHEVGRGALNPVLFTYSNRHIASNIRSTANSIRSSAQTLGAALGLAISGLLTIVIHPLGVWAIVAIGILVLSGYAWMRRKSY